MAVSPLTERLLPNNSLASMRLLPSRRLVDKYTTEDVTYSQESAESPIFRTTVITKRVGYAALLTPGDFCPFNKWDIHQEEDRAPTLRDRTTGKHYEQAGKGTIRLKGVALFFGTAIQAGIGVGSMLLETGKVVSGYHFWKKGDGTCREKVKRGCVDSLKSVVLVGCTPFYVTALACAAIYTIVNPFDGRKLYGSIETAWTAHRGCEDYTSICTKKEVHRNGTWTQSGSLVEEAPLPTPFSLAPCFRPKQPYCEEAVTHLLNQLGVKVITFGDTW